MPDLWNIVLILLAAFFLLRFIKKRRQAKAPIKKLVGLVVHVYDGDTILLSGKEKVRVRLAGIDAPEKDQPYGDEARIFLARLIRRKRVLALVNDVDKYDRYVAKIICNGRDINAAMIKAGYAWHYKYYNHDRAYAELEKNARKKHLGLWQDKHPEAPWDFRYYQRRNK